MYCEILHGYLAVCLHLTPDDLEPSEFKVIKFDIKHFENGDNYDNGVN